MRRRRLGVALASCVLLAGTPAWAVAPQPSVDPRPTDLVTDAPFVIETIGDLDPNDPVLIERMQAIDDQLDRRLPSGAALELAPGQQLRKPGSPHHSTRTSRPMCGRS
ncbi:MAG: hypothetical protein R2710_09740 [Acidimicrobiales bacterium]